MDGVQPPLEGLAVQPLAVADGVAVPDPVAALAAGAAPASRASTTAAAAPVVRKAGPRPRRVERMGVSPWSTPRAGRSDDLRSPPILVPGGRAPIGRRDDPGARRLSPG
ncbi:hypothetical protein GCM10020254_71650 [Streptomyces goshikiensis]